MPRCCSSYSPQPVEAILRNRLHKKMISKFRFSHYLKMPMTTFARVFSQQLMISNLPLRFQIGTRKIFSGEI